MNALLALSLLLLTDMTSDVAADETLLFYPSLASQTADKPEWEATIHGIVYQPAGGGVIDRATLGLFRRFAGISEEEAESEIFQMRAKAFLVDNERKRDIFIQLGDKVEAVGRSTANGHFEATLSLSAEVVAGLQKRPEYQQGTLTFSAVLADDKRKLTGHLQFLPPTGWSVISDIDDTIKISQVGDRKALVRNTFLKPFEPVPGMADLYRGWADRGAAFHYVTASPWQLYLPLEEFRAANRFPPGTWQMKFFRWKDSSILDLLGSQVGYKTATIEPLLTRFPKRKFILVGDTGEQDPEIYGSLARKYPEQIAKIVIRDVSEQGIPAERLQKAFADLPEGSYAVFREPEELAKLKDVVPK